MNQRTRRGGAAGRLRFRAADGEGRRGLLPRKRGKERERGLRGILLMLAEAESTHYELFRRMKAHEETVVPDSKLLDQVKNIFAGLNAREAADGADSAEVELYRTAQELERRSWELYDGHAEQAASPAERRSVAQIAVEERRHYRILEGIIDFVSRPQQWLENAEWNHLEDY